MSLMRQGCTNISGSTTRITCPFTATSQHLRYVTSELSGPQASMAIFLVRNLNKAWGARWQHGDWGQSTESSHWMQVIELINKLLAKPGWNLALAQCFLLERYEEKMTTWKFRNYIQKDGGAGSNQIMKAALSYPAWSLLGLVLLHIHSYLS